ncbi:MAG TPA: hypothetical protein VGM98_03065 [Schlesneria sp.]|jgi:hypothetical protein
MGCYGDLAAADYKTLESNFGPDGAMATFRWLFRGLNTTSVSAGFQFPLEHDNVRQPLLVRDWQIPK